MKRFTKIFLFIFLGLNFKSNCADHQPTVTLGYELAKDKILIDNSMNIIRDEYKALQDHWKVPKNRKAKPFWSRINYFLGYYQVDEMTSPLLYKTVKELGEKLKILSVSKKFTCDVYIYEGNKLSNFMSYLSGADFRINAWAMSNNQRSGSITFGSDVIDNFNYGELRAVAAHELGHIKRNHIVKSYFLGMGLTLITGFAANLLLPFIVPVTVKYGIFGLPSYTANRVGINILQTYAIETVARAAAMPLMGLSRKFEKEADLMAFYATNDAYNLVSALDKLHSLYKKRHPFWHTISEGMEYLDPFSYLMPVRSHPTTEQRAIYLDKVAKGDVSKNSLYYKIVQDMENKKEFTLSPNEATLVLGKDVQTQIAG